MKTNGQNRDIDVGKLSITKL